MIRPLKMNVFFSFFFRILGKVAVAGNAAKHRLASDRKLITLFQRVNQVFSSVRDTVATLDGSREFVDGKKVAHLQQL